MVVSIAQDPQGFMWFAGYQGLCRYDGYDFKMFNHNPEDPNSISSSIVHKILVDRQGQLWAATQGGLNRYRPDTEDFVRYLAPPETSDNDLLNSAPPISANTIATYDMSEDSQGNIWLACADEGLIKLQKGSTKLKRFNLQASNIGDKHNPPIPINDVRRVFADKQGHIWMAVESSQHNSAGVARMTPPKPGAQGSIIDVHYYPANTDPSEPGDSDTLSGSGAGALSDRVANIYQDHQGQLWFALNIKGLNRYDPLTDQFIHYQHHPDQPSSLGHNEVRAFWEDHQGNFWLGTDKGGLNRFRRQTQSFEHYRHQSNDPTSIASDKVWSLYQDRANSLWLGHFPSGVSTINDYASAFTVYRHEAYNTNSLSQNEVLSIVETKGGNLWVGTEKGLNFIQRSSGRITRYWHKPNKPQGLSADAVLALRIDSDGHLWTGTWRGGLSRFLGDPDHPPPPEVATFKHYQHDPSKPTSIGSNNVMTLFEDRAHTLWIGTINGLQRYRRKTDDFVRYQSEPTKGRETVPHVVRAIIEDDQGRLWVGSDLGLSLLDSQQQGFRHFLSDSLDPTSIGDGDVFALVKGGNGTLWLGLAGGGISKFDLNSFEAKTYHLEHGLPDATIAGIVQDNQGILWLNTGYGVVRFDPETQHFRHYLKAHGLAGNLSRGGYYKTAKGEVVFGSTTGMTVFRPEDVFINSEAPPVVITDFKLFNASVPITTDGSPLRQSINQSESLILNHKQSVFSFEFAALNYRMPSLNTYAYMLEGFDDKWVYIGTKRSATYTNIDPGEYRFHVKAANNEGIWNEIGTSITIHILPPWWKRWWAYTAYLLILGSILALLFFTFLQQRRAKDERLLNQKLRELDKTKDSFLASTSHELRTPLNGIIGLSQSLIDGAGGQQSNTSIENLKLIVGSGKRLSYLINDILDYSKLKEHEIEIHRKAVDLHPLVNSIFSLTEPSLEGKPVQLHNDVDKYMSSLMADENRLQQILHNIIGNAVKFTERGTITVSAEEIDCSLCITVKDTGVGIAPENIDKIFSAFEQEQASLTRSSGTGLGLAVTKQLVELHGGNIELSSVLGEGTRVTFSLSISDNVIASSPKLEDPLTQASEKNHRPILDNTSQALPSPDASAFHILVVDDEPINRRVLLNMLQLKNYRVSQCSSGFNALELLQNSDHDIDLVLLDVMMPGISGYETCQRLRKQYSVIQLPILFLTAKSQVSDLTEAYRVGGNDYLTKPIVQDELLARIDTQLTLLELNFNLEKKVEQRTQALNQALIHRKQMQTQLVQSEKMSGLGVLVAGIGHEIKNPTNYLSATLVSLGKSHADFKTVLFDMLGEDADQEISQLFTDRFEDLNQYVNTLVNGSERIKGVVGNLQTFSRTDAGNMQRACLRKGLESTLELVKANYKTEVTFVCDIEDDPLIECVPSELNQVFMNLMVNACQAMRGGDKKTSDISPSILTITMKKIIEQENSELVISFKDTGCGMTQEVTEKIFDPFFTTKPDGEGTGLGMAISYGIVERHHGRLQVETTLGKGTCIRLKLPLENI